MIGLSLDTLKEERWQRDRDRFVAAAEKLGAKVEVLSANSDDKAQAQDMNSFISKRADAIVIVPHDAKAMAQSVQAARDADVKRLLVVGGGGSLEVAPGLELLDAPGFPEEHRGPAEGPREALRLLRTETVLDWTMLCPGAIIEPGERTGQFRLGTDQLLVNAAGESRISVQDFALAMIDELEKPAHSRRRFTVGY